MRRPPPCWRNSSTSRSNSRLATGTDCLQLYASEGLLSQAPTARRLSRPFILPGTGGRLYAGTPREPLRQGTRNRGQVKRARARLELRRPTRWEPITDRVGGRSGARCSGLSSVPHHVEHAVLRNGWQDACSPTTGVPPHAEQADLRNVLFLALLVGGVPKPRLCSAERVGPLNKRATRFRAGLTVAGVFLETTWVASWLAKPRCHGRNERAACTAHAGLSCRTRERAAGDRWRVLGW